MDFIHTSGELNIELSSEFILFISTLMRIKAKMLLPRKEVDEQGNEIDPRQELVDKILEYKKFKEAIGLTRAGGGISINSAPELDSQLKSLLTDQKKLENASKSSFDFVQQNKGATEKIMNVIQENRRFTK